MRMYFLTASLLIGLSPWCMAGQVYKWVDGQGVTHFDAQPPQGQLATTIVIPASAPPKPAPAPASTAPSDPKAIESTVKQQIAQQEAQRKVFCDQARTNLAQLQNNPRLRENTEGEMRRLTDEQRQVRIIETQKAIADNCQ